MPDSEKNAASESPHEPSQGTLSGSSYEAEDVFEGAEPWDPIETKIVLGTFAAAIVLLAIFAFLIDKYLLTH